MPFLLCRHKIYTKGLDNMTYEEERAAEDAAEIEKLFLPLQECHKEKYRAWLLEPVVDRNKALKAAKLRKKMLACVAAASIDNQCDVGDLDPEDPNPDLAPKAPTHAGYLNSLANRVQQRPDDKDTLSKLLYTVHDDAAFDFFSGKFVEGEGLTVNGSWTAEDTATLIRSARKLAADPLNTLPWPDEFDDSEHANEWRKLCHAYIEALHQSEEEDREDQADAKALR
jgi:hypothetical protein